MARRTDRRPPILGPVVLITIGVLALMQNFGQLPASFWPTLWRMWPIILVLIGVELLLGQLRLPWAASFLLALLVIGAAIGGVVYLAMQAPVEEERAAAEMRSMQTDLQGVTDAKVRLEFGAGELEVGSTSAANIMEGEFAETSTRRMQVSYSGSGGHGDLRLAAVGPGWPLATGSNHNRWNVRLNDSIPLDLRVEAGLSSNDLDLSALKLSALRIEAGLSTNQVRLAQTGSYNARISCGLSTTTITIPEGVAARIRVQSGLSSVSVDEARFPKLGDLYVSPGYDAAANRVDLTVEGGMATLTIR